MNFTCRWDRVGGVRDTNITGIRRSMLGWVADPNRRAVNGTWPLKASRILSDL